MGEQKAEESLQSEYAHFMGLAAESHQSVWLNGTSGRKRPHFFSAEEAEKTGRPIAALLAACPQSGLILAE